MSGVMAVSHFGVPVSQDDGSVVMFAEAHAALTAYQTYAITASRDTTDNDQDGSADNTGYAVTAAPATLAVNHWIGIPQKDYAAGDMAMLLIGGAGKMKVDTSAVLATSFLKATNAGTLGTLDGAAQTVKSIARACEANGGVAATINVQMLGLPAQV